MRYSFSGHESFFCKAMWLKKGYDFISSGNKFTDSDAVVKLGVGKNMVAAIRYWLKSFGLTKDDELTPIAKYVFNDAEGKDPYTEDKNTLWLLHYLIVTRKVASIYNLLFLDFQREKREFDKGQLLSFIKRKCDTPEQKNVFNENTVKKDIRVLLQNYVAPTSAKSLDEYSGLLLDLGLIRNNDNTYSFNEVKIGQIHPLIIYFALLDMANCDKTLSNDKLNALSLIFCMSKADFLQNVRDLCEKYSGELTFTDNSGIRNVHIMTEINKYGILDRYYEQRYEF